MNFTMNFFTDNKISVKSGQKKGPQQTLKQLAMFFPLTKYTGYGRFKTFICERPVSCEVIFKTSF